MSSIAMPIPDPSIVERRSEIVAALTKALPPGRVIADDDGRRAFETDALTAYRCMPLAVVMPQSTEEVATVLKYCGSEGVKVIPRAAGTSLVGGALPTADAIVLCISKMNKMLEVDYPNRCVRVEAGITNLAVTGAVTAAGFFYAPDPSSQLASTIAGNIAMNSGGAHCLKYGVTTNNVLGIKMVTMDGEIVELGGGHLDSGTYDLLGMVVGSEGQIGVVTEATLRILKAAEGARPIMLGFETVEEAGRAVTNIIASGMIPVAIEFMDKPAIQICEAFAKAGYPLDVEALLIIEVEGSPSEIDQALAKMQDLARPFNPKAVVVSSSPEQSAKIWKGRKSAFGAVGRLADYYCMDGTIPLGKLSEMLAAIAEICQRRDLRVANIFHAGDGNLHPLILYNANDEAEAARAEQAGAEILTKCVEFGGCLTGEHGVGIEKRELMRVQFNDVDLGVQVRLKTAFDSDWLLNPAKVFPLSSRPRPGDATAA